MEMNRYNEALHKYCSIYCHLPIIVSDESMADLVGLVSTAGKMRYIGSPSFANEDLQCTADDSYFHGSCWMISGGSLKFMSNIELVISLIKYSTSHWGLLALCNAIRRFHPDVHWADEVIKLNLEGRLFELLTDAVKLGEDDKSIISGAKYRIEQAHSRLYNIQSTHFIASV